MKGFQELKEEVIEKELCTRCGTCIGICPAGTLAYVGEKITDKDEKCVQCGMCSAVCPGKEFPMNEWSKKLFDEDYQVSALFGSYLGIWNAYALDDEIRNIGSSGGVITQILVDLLKRHVVEGVVSVRETKDKPYEFESFIADEESQIVAAAQSKYAIIPVNKVIQDIRQSGKKVAYVGLPCQIHGMRKAMEKNAWLREQAAVLIAPFCGFNMEYDAMRYLIGKSGIEKDKIEKLSYRYKKGNQTGFYIRGKDGKEFFIPKHGYTFLNLMFSPKRCWKCFDYSGEFADISVGDAWEMGQGFSRVIVRTKTGADLFETLRVNGKLYAQEADENAIVKTQNKVVTYKKKQIALREKKMQYFPDYGVEFAPCVAKVRMKGMILYRTLAFFKTAVGKRCISVLPFKLLVKISEKIKGREVTQVENK